MRLKEILDYLYCLGLQYGIKEADMRLLCTQLGVDYQRLLKHTGPSVPNH